MTTATAREETGRRGPRERRHECLPALLRGGSWPARRSRGWIRAGPSWKMRGDERVTELVDEDRSEHDARVDERRRSLVVSMPPSRSTTIARITTADQLTKIGKPNSLGSVKPPFISRRRRGRRPASVAARPPRRRRRARPRSRRRRRRPCSRRSRPRRSPPRRTDGPRVREVGSTAHGPYTTDRSPVDHLGDRRADRADGEIVGAVAVDVAVASTLVPAGRVLPACEHACR